MKIKPTSEKPKSASKVSSRSHLGECTPRLRFPGFEGAWSAEYFDDIATGFEYGLNAAAVNFDGVHKYIRITDIDDTSHKFIGSPVVSPAGEIDEKYRVRPNDILLARTGASTGKSYLYDSSDGELYFAGFLIRASVKPEYDARFVFYSTCTPPYRRWVNMISMRSGQPGINADEYSRYNLNIPTHSEQVQIGTFLALLDSKITAQHKLVELLKKHKRGVIEQIFGRRLDMGKDAEKWDIVELRDLFSKVARRNRDGKVKNVITNSAEFGLIPQRDFFDKSIAVDGNTDGYYVIRTGDFVYNPRKSTAAPFGPFNRYMGKEDGIISPLYTCLVPKGKANPEYLAWYFRSTAWHRYVYDNGSQGARHDRVNMTDDLLFGIPVLLPPIAVQERIADGLNAIDARWSSANKVLAHLEKMKRGLLKQLFA